MSNTTDTTSSNRSRRIKFWGVAIVLLMMVLMIFSSNPLTGRGAGGHGSSPTVGTTRDGGRVTAEDRARALRLLETLEAVYIRSGQIQPQPLPEMCWGPEVVNAFRRDPEALHLVLAASRKTGPGTSPLTLGALNPDERSTQDTGIFNSGVIYLDQLHPLPSSPLGRLAISDRGPQIASIATLAPDRRSLVAPATLSSADQRVFFEALDDFLTIQSAASITNGALKVSRPVVDRLVAERMQRMTIRLAGVDASSQLADVPVPSEAQLAEHFAKFAGSTAGVATKDNAFGFGYRVADRVKLEWITLDRATVRAAVEAEKSAFDWEVEARMAFAKDPAAFASLAPSTQPTTGEATAATATSQPTFDAVKAGAIRLHVDRAAAAKLLEIERRIRAQLTNDYQAWTAARTAKATTAPTSVGAAIDAADYLDRVAASVTRQFKIAPSVDRLADTLRDQRELAAASPSFAAFERVGQAINRATGMPSYESAPSYAARAASTQPSAANEEPIALYQPSQTVTDPNDAKHAIFRVVAADPSHAAASLASVREQVVNDWKLEQAQTIAVQKATADAEAVRQNRPATLNLEWKTVVLDQSPVAAAALGLTQDAVAQLREAANDVLLVDSENAQPIAAIGVPLARRAYVAQRQRLDPMWKTADELASLREEGRSIVATMMAEPASPTNPFGLTAYSVGSAWLDVKQIYERAGWTPSNPASN